MSYVDMYIFVINARVRSLVAHCHILREVSACLLVQLRWAIPEPPIVERATSTALTLFLFIRNLMPMRGVRRQGC